KKSLLLAFQIFQLFLILGAFGGGGIQVKGAVLMYRQQDFQLFFQCDKHRFFQPGSIRPYSMAAAVCIGSRMAAHIKRLLLSNAGECMVTAATIDLAF